MCQIDGFRANGRKKQTRKDRKIKLGLSQITFTASVVSTAVAKFNIVTLTTIVRVDDETASSGTELLDGAAFVVKFNSIIQLLRCRNEIFCPFNTY
ncbi:unnamed protein product [Onchocerca flexuosa]|uniref:Uncharacterized protein n=1 Tax=Onchocerca flexuosa TaxID=387005 RepID=A0A183HGA4_9BILA|nr:unnamed protein product [Onchocerca flexuosa]